MLRTQLVTAMRDGKFLLIDIDGPKADMHAEEATEEWPAAVMVTADDEHWPSSDIWDYKKWDNEDMYKTILNESETKDKDGNDLPPFVKMPGFALGIIVEDHNSYIQLARSLPHVAQMRKFTII